MNGGSKNHLVLETDNKSYDGSHVPAGKYVVTCCKGTNRGQILGSPGPDEKMSQFLKALRDDEDPEERRDSSNGRLQAGTGRTYRMTAALVAFVGSALLFIASARGRLATRTTRNSWSNDGSLLSNGTHAYERTVVLISIDGMRADYLDRGFTPNLVDIGLRAQWMRPSFPTNTFPNHWTLLTGLYPSSHGIVANHFFDPVTGAPFDTNKPDTTQAASWWGGEPLWETASKAGLKTADVFWVGPPKTRNGYEHDYSISFDKHMKMDSKREKIIKWLELPQQDRPRFITVYEPGVDRAGHRHGPDSHQVNDELQKVDAFARDLYKDLQSRNLNHIVDVIFVSDHGMIQMHKDQVVVLDEILGVDGMNALGPRDGWPSAGLRFQRNETDYLKALQTYADEFPDRVSVYTPDTMPPHFHFTGHPYIAPIYVVPKLGWSVIFSNETGRVKVGDHGYDNHEPEMRASFITYGPFAQYLKQTRHREAACGMRKPTRQGLFSGILSLFFGAPVRLASCTLAPEASLSTESPLVIDAFDNTEIYGLVVKLLGIEAYAAPNNGTGFWDKYFVDPLSS